MVKEIVKSGYCFQLQGYCPEFLPRSARNPEKLPRQGLAARHSDLLTFKWKEAQSIC